MAGILSSVSMVDKRADLSPCGRYRYFLRRVWDVALPSVLIIGLNPSVADVYWDDRTICKCIGFARGWGYGGIVMANLFAFRATDPRDMLAAADPIGPDNDATLRRLASEAGLILAAWGNHGAHLGRDAAVRALLPPLHCLRVSKTGQPCHPLYLPSTLVPVPYEPAAGA